MSRSTRKNKLILADHMCLPKIGLFLLRDARVKPLSIEQRVKKDIPYMETAIRAGEMLINYSAPGDAVDGL